MLHNNLDQPFTENDTKAAIKLLKSKKAPGRDRIRSEVLKCGVLILAPSLTKFFNVLLKTGSRLNAWSSGVISTVFKQVTSLILRIGCLLKTVLFIKWCC